MSGDMEVSLFWTVFGIVFAVAVGVGGSIFGAWMSGKAALKAKRYETHFAEKRAAYEAFIKVAVRVVSVDRWSQALVNDLSVAVHYAALFSGRETEKMLDRFESVAVRWITANFDGLTIDAYDSPAVALPKVISRMKEELYHAHKRPKKSAGYKSEEINYKPDISKSVDVQRLCEDK